MSVEKFHVIRDQQPVVVNVSNWKIEALEIAVEIANQMHISLKTGEKSFGSDPTKRPVFIINAPEKGLTDFWKRLAAEVPDYWEKSSE